MRGNKGRMNILTTSAQYCKIKDIVKAIRQEKEIKGLAIRKKNPNKTLNKTEFK